MIGAWTDNLGITTHPDGRYEVRPAVISKILVASCPDPEHQLHAEIYWNDGNIALLTEVDGYFVATDLDQYAIAGVNLQTTTIIDQMVTDILEGMIQ